MTRTPAVGTWEQVELGSVIEQADYGLSLRGQRSGQFPILRMNCQERGRVVFRDLQFVDLDTKTFEKYRLQDGDLLFNRTNSFELVGRTALFSGSEPAVFASYLVRLRVRREKMLPSFLNFYLQLKSVQAALKGFATRGVSQSNISASKLRTLPVIRPAIPEQARIVVGLDSLQRAALAQDRLLRAVKQLRAATMAKLFREGLLDDTMRSSEIGEIPASWRIRRLRTLLKESLRNGHSAAVSHNGQGVPTLTLTAITKNDFSSDNVKHTVAAPSKVANLWLRDGDVFVERANTKGMVGLSAVYRGRSDFAIFPDLLIRVRVNDEIAPEFINEWFLSSWGRRYFQTHCRGTASSMPKIDQGILEEMPVPVPGSDEQKMAVAMIKALDGQGALVSARLALLRETFQTVLHGLMTGELRLKAA